MERDRMMKLEGKFTSGMDSDSEARVDRLQHQLRKGLNEKFGALLGDAFSGAGFTLGIIGVPADKDNPDTDKLVFKSRVTIDLHINHEGTTPEEVLAKLEALAATHLA